MGAGRHRIATATGAASERIPSGLAVLTVAVAVGALPYVWMGPGYRQAMLIWINGPFGAGKSVTAVELQRRVDGAVISDPEHVGYGLHRALPTNLRGDFQDFASWRTGVVEVLDLALRSHDGPVIAPMTLVEPAYFAEILGGLRDLDHDVRHFSLLPDRHRVRRRLRLRALRMARRDTFALNRLDHCLDQLARPEYGVHVPAGRLTVGELADFIAGKAGIGIHANTDGRVRGALRRTATSVKQIRK